MTPKPHPRVETFLAQAGPWRAVLMRLRALLLAAGLREEYKWSKPCYCHDEGNVAILQPFKAYCAVLFFKGSLLQDPDGALFKTGPNSEVGRQLRFTSVREVEAQAGALRDFVKQAIAVEKAGLSVATLPPAELPMPPELRQALDAQPALQQAFTALTPGRQRAYLFYFAGAKQSVTRSARVKKCAPRILRGKGLHDD